MPEQKEWPLERFLLSPPKVRTAVILYLISWMIFFTGFIKFYGSFSLVEFLLPLVFGYFLFKFKNWAWIACVFLQSVTAFGAIFWMAMGIYYKNLDFVYIMALSSLLFFASVFYLLNRETRSFFKKMKEMDEVGTRSFFEKMKEMLEAVE